MLETDLYLPIKNYFESKGYLVQAEVNHCDLVAKKDDELIIVELKTSANMSLLIQATARQAISDLVYVAIPQPKKLDKHWRGVKRVLKRLGLGLLVVVNGNAGQSINCYLEPTGHIRRNNRKRKLVEKEVTNRHASYNTGGSTGVPIITAYKQDSIVLACLLESLGEAKTHELRALGCGANTAKILYHNHYGWFERRGRATYRLTTEGKQAPKQLSDIYPIAATVAKTRLAKAGLTHENTEPES